MTFLNPLVLWGLAAVSIPILIHIFNLKRTKKIEFFDLNVLKGNPAIKIQKDKAETTAYSIVQNSICNIIGNDVCQAV